MVVLKILKNKYFIVIVSIALWLLYFDKNDLFSHLALINRCDKLNAEKEYYIAEIEKNKKEIYELQHNTKSLETFAREKYFMKKENEDVFVFITKK